VQGLISEPVSVGNGRVVVSFWRRSQIEIMACQPPKHVPIPAVTKTCLPNRQPFDPRCHRGASFYFTQLRPVFNDVLNVNIAVGIVASSLASSDNGSSPGAYELTPPLFLPNDVSHGAKFPL